MDTRPRGPIEEQEELGDRDQGHSECRRAAWSKCGTVSASRGSIFWKALFEGVHQGNRLTLELSCWGCFC